MKTYPNSRAFPSHEAQSDDFPNSNDPRNQISGGGLSKREYFAIHIAQGMNGIIDSMNARKVTMGMAVELADELIARLNGTPDETTNKD